MFTNRHAVEGYQGAIRRFENFGSTAKLHYGVEVLQDSIESNNLGYHSRARGAGYVALDVRALKRFSFNVGLRDEIYGSANHQLSPGASAGFWLSRTWKLRAGASRAFRLPTYTDLYYHDPANVGSPNLRPESAWSYEGGVDWSPSTRIHAEATLFERRERDGIDYVRYSANDIWRATNFSRLNFTGVETSVRTTVAAIHDLELQYTGLHGASAAFANAFSKYSFNYPIHSGVASWQARWRHGILTRTRVGALERYGRDPYAVVDFYAASTRGRFHPFLQLGNLTDTAYQEIFGVAMPGRSVVGGVEFVWRRN